MELYPGSSVSPSITAFAEQVELVPQAIKDATCRKPFVTWPQGRHVPKMLRSRLERTYTFKLRDTEYKVDATSAWYPGSPQEQQYAPLSLLSIRHDEWSTHLSHLETMGAGNDPGWPRDNILE